MSDSSPTRSTSLNSTSTAPSHVGPIAVLGAGKLGAPVALLLAGAGQTVHVWARRAEVAQSLAQSSSNIRAASTIADAVREASMICFAVPTQALREVARMAGDATRGDQIALHACRGVEQGFKLPHEIIRAETCIKQVGVLGGPLYLDDAARGRPLVAVVGSRFDAVPRVMKRMTSGTRVRIHGTRDVTGVEVCGAISNVAHVAAGLAAGLGLGETDQSILLTRGLVEATRIGVALGADRSTFAGLAGVGDLIPRPVTSTRRHRRLGEEIGGGRDAAHATASSSDLEGLRTAREAQALAERLGLSLPLIEAVDAVLFRSRPPAVALEKVLAMDLDLEVPVERST